MKWVLRGGLGVALIGCTVVLLLEYMRSKEEVAFLMELADLDSMVLGEAVVAPIPFSLPRGDTKDLFKWLSGRPGLDQLMARSSQRIIDAKDGTVRDFWGRELVYHFPSQRKGVLFDLYSLGPNGVDQGGEGKNLDCRIGDRLDSLGYLFKDGRVDIEWIKVNMGKLKVDPATGKLVVVSEEATSQGAITAP